MIKPLVIKKDPNDFKHLKVKDEGYKRIVDLVDLYDLSKFINSLNKEEWVPDCYWNKNKLEFNYPELYWSIFSYLIDKKILIIEDRYYGYNPKREKYVKRDSFDNTLSEKLYKPITERLEQSGFIEYDRGYYLLSKSYYKLKLRKKNLNKITFFLDEF